MRWLATGLALLVLTATVSAETLHHDGMERSYILERPSDINGPAPTVFVLHGGSRSAEKIRRSTRFHERAGPRGVVTVYPDGIGNQWNDARNASAVRGNQGGEDIDDVGFLTALARHLVATAVADPRRIYVTGSSNGGMMTFRLACEAAETFAAFAPVIASMPAAAQDSCRPAGATPLLMMNGTEDRLIPWNGGIVAPMFPGDRGEVLSVMHTIEIFRKFNNCRESEREAFRHPDDRGQPLNFILRLVDCDDFSEVVLYRFEGMGHRWPEARIAELPGMLGRLLGPAPKDFPAAEHLLDFFDRHRLRD